MQSELPHYELMHTGEREAITAWFRLHRTHAQTLPSSCCGSFSPSQVSLLKSPSKLYLNPKSYFFQSSIPSFDYNSFPINPSPPNSTERQPALYFPTQTYCSSCSSYPDNYCSFSHIHILIRSLTPCPNLLNSGLM